VVSLGKQVMCKASELRERYSLSFWDSTIVASALQCGATTLYSEDLRDGLVIDGTLSIVNPFLSR
jgi:predicted nucleic acid-binding protein